MLSCITLHPGTGTRECIITCVDKLTSKKGHGATMRIRKRKKKKSVHVMSTVFTVVSTFVFVGDI
jgi:hypothetical protein